MRCKPWPVAVSVRGCAGLPANMVDMCAHCACEPWQREVGLLQMQLTAARSTSKLYTTPAAGDTRRVRNTPFHSWLLDHELACVCILCAVLPACSWLS
jgi:hypothetical protein